MWFREVGGVVWFGGGMGSAHPTLTVDRRRVALARGARCPLCFLRWGLATPRRLGGTGGGGRVIPTALSPPSQHVFPPLPGTCHPPVSPPHLFPPLLPPNWGWLVTPVTPVTPPSPPNVPSVPILPISPPKLGPAGVGTPLPLPPAPRLLPTPWGGGGPAPTPYPGTRGRCGAAV